MNRKNYNLLIENWRRFLNENKINTEIDDDVLRKFLSAIYTVVSCISDDEIDDIQEYEMKSLSAMGVDQNDIDNLITYMNTLSKDEQYDLADSMMGIYNIKKSVFQNLGFTEKDIDALKNYDSGLNNDSSYDYWNGVSVSERGDTLEFSTEH